MLKRISTGITTLALTTILSGALPTGLRAEDMIEKAGVGLGLTAGNAMFLPSKALSASMGLFFGAVSFLLTGGDTEVAHQMWRFSTADPYLITPELARKAIGSRPELSRTEDN